jgi:hypothetical protein
MDFNTSSRTNVSTEGSLRMCNEFVVTYYWSEEAEGVHLVTNLVLIPMLIILAVAGVMLNLLLIIAYAKNSRLRTMPAMMLVTLACSDFLISILVKPLYAARLIMEIFGSHYCPLWISSRLITYFSCGLSLLTIAIMTIERFVTLAYPYRHLHILTPFRLKTIVIITWLTTFLLVISHLRLVPHAILLFVGATLNLLSLTIVISIWIWIHRLLHKHKNTIWARQTPSHASRCNTKIVFRNTKTSYLVVSFLLLCYFPSLLLLGYFATSESVSFTMTFIVDPWAEAVMFANAVLNPFLVLYRNKDFRECVKVLLPWYENNVLAGLWSELRQDVLIN